LLEAPGDSIRRIYAPERRIDLAVENAKERCSAQEGDQHAEDRDEDADDQEPFLPKQESFHMGLHNVLSMLGDYRGNNIIMALNLEIVAPIYGR